MFITLKNLQQQTFILEFDDSQMVIKLKEKIEAERGKDYPAENQKLIYAGMILDDNRTVASYNVDEKKFIVVMVKKVTKSIDSSETGDGGTLSKTGLGTTKTSPVTIKDDKLNKNVDTCSKMLSEQEKNNLSDNNSGKIVAGGSSTSTITLSTDDINKSAEKIIKMEIVDNKVEKMDNISDGGSGSSKQSKDGDSKSSSIGATPLAGGTTFGSGGGGGGGTTTTITGSLPSTTATSSAGDGGNFSSTNVQSSAESALIMGHEYDSIVQNIVEMGYRRPLVEQALRASFNNPDRAVEYLISGIPDTNEEMDLDRSTAVAIGSAQTMPTVALSDAADPLAFLRQQPQFQQMRTVLHRNPELLNAVLQQIGLTNPALLQLISENQEAFVNMLNERDGNGVGGDASLPAALMASLSGAAPGGVGGSSGGNLTGMEGGRPAQTGGGGGGGGSGSGGNNGGGDNVPTDGSGMIAVNAQDRESIERLKALGFPEHLVLQAYFACEKNENLAANFLLLQTFDD